MSSKGDILRKCLNARAAEQGSEIDRVASINIRLYPAEVLRQQAKRISLADAGGEIEELVREMLEAMREARGVGLAANQVGRAVRLIVIGSFEEEGEERVLINPVIKNQKGKTVEEEACLSVPGVNGKVRRAGRVLVEAEDLQGRKQEIEAEGILARVLQHEIDHLDGRLFVDRLSPVAKIQVQGLLRDMERRRGSG